MVAIQRRNAEGVIEGLLDIQLGADRLSAHSTIRSNKALSTEVAAIKAHAKDTAMKACFLYFKGDHLEDLPESA